ncbi:MAG TPA: GNAT family N-acetyltransferase [Chthonomonadaceae bacterium]|nr:GNAT family N-acetyltransferase [Chthonomonadaceae bacterium]
MTRLPPLAIMARVEGAVLPDGTPIGAVWSRLLQPDEGGSYVDAETPQVGIAVLPEYHNRGVGTALLSHYVEAASRRYQAVTLSVHPENHARFLYEKCGFVRYGAGGGGYWQMIHRFATGG